MASIFSTSPTVHVDAMRSADNTPNTDAFDGFAVVAGDYMPNTEVDTTTGGNSYGQRRVPYSSKPFFAPGLTTPSTNAAAPRSAFHQSDDWMTPTMDVNGPPLNRFHVYAHSPVSDAPDYDGYDRMPLHQRTPLPPPPPLPPQHTSGAHTGINMSNGGVGGVDGRVSAQSSHGTPHGVGAGGGGGGPNPYTYRGPNADYSSRKQNRLHQDFKALPKEERQRLVEKEAATSDLLARTVHLRFLPLTMLQSELAEICIECGEYLRVRICGNSTNNQNWIYGFVEFSTTAAAEAMMRRSGMELHNGPGRPPLRLKCNCAKQPIVDRVFHDADPATGNPCIFGLGNFAKRSLGDALESYYNLKEKEAGGQLGDVLDTPSPANLSPMLPATRPPMRLSPHARAFQPAATALLGAEFLPGVHNAAASTTSNSNNNNSGTPNSAHWTTPLLSATAVRKADSDSGSSDSTAAGATPTAVNQYTHRALSSSAGTTPHTAFTPLQGGSCTVDGFSGAAPASGRVGTTSGASAAAGGAFPAGLSFTSATAAPRFASIHSDRLLSPEGPTAMAPASLGGRVSSGFAADLLLPPSRHDAAAAYSVCGGGNSAGFGSSTPSDVAGSELSLALQSMMLTRAGTDGEEVLERGQELALRAMGQAHDFLNSQQGFYDAMGTLRSLIELLDCHAAVTGGATSTGAGDHTAHLPQRATQLRLLANLMMALLYMMKRNLSEALPYIHAVVMSCNDIPVVNLWKRVTALKQGGSRRSSSTSNSSSTSSNDNSEQRKKAAQQQRWMGLAVGGNTRESAEAASGYDCFGGPTDFLAAVLESIRDDEDDGNGATEGTAAAAAGAKSTTDPTSVNGDTVSTSSAETQALLRRDHAFHRYVLNVLVAIGLSMEEVQPAITRSTYALAAGRAKDVLNASCEDLDECLLSTAANPRLCDRLYAPPLTASSKRDITFFPRIFFASAESVRLAVESARDKELFWQSLPPTQCVQCYVE